jgi:hypothetical protein
MLSVRVICPLYVGNKLKEWELEKLKHIDEQKVLK